MRPSRVWALSGARRPTIARAGPVVATWAVEKVSPVAAAATSF
ncbi:MAG: hypothetical protein ABSD97_03440 [Acidimicrobiales bacterium]